MMKFNQGPKLIPVVTLAGLMLASSLCVLGQSSGRIKGTVRAASGVPVSGVSVVATNQVTSKWKRVRTNPDGTYSIQLNAGAYRLRVAAPHVAKFDKDKNYGDF